MTMEEDPRGTMGHNRPDGSVVPGDQQEQPDRDDVASGVDTDIGSVGSIGTSSGVGTGRGASSSTEEDEMGGPGTSDEG